MGDSVLLNPRIWPPIFYSKPSSKSDCTKIIAVEIVRKIARMPSYSIVVQQPVVVAPNAEYYGQPPTSPGAQPFQGFDIRAPAPRMSTQALL